jgi:hypothetical protein
LLVDLTRSYSEPGLIFTVRGSIDGGDKCLRNPDEEKPDESIDKSVDSFLALFFISPSCDDDIECIDHHDYERK